MDKEFRAIPSTDLADLFGAMKAYRQELDGGFTIKRYGDGLMMIKANNRSQGRCLFFSLKEDDGVEVLTALLAYKKETNEVPKRLLDTARDRMSAK